MHFGCFLSNLFQTFVGSIYWNKVFLNLGKTSCCAVSGAMRDSVRFPDDFASCETVIDFVNRDAFITRDLINPSTTIRTVIDEI